MKSGRTMILLFAVLVVLQIEPLFVDGSPRQRGCVKSEWRKEQKYLHLWPKSFPCKNPAPNNPGPIYPAPKNLLPKNPSPCPGQPLKPFFPDIVDVHVG